MQTNELFEPGEYIDQRGPGYFSILSKPYGRARQDSYELELLPTVVECVNPEIDTWITQATFSQPNRRCVNALAVGLLFADLDTYHVPNLASRGPEEQARLLAGFCAEEGIPLPSLVLFSGRGLQPKWLLTEAVPAADLTAWNAAQLALTRLLEPFAADGSAKDISRVLRLDRTTNTKSGERCRIVYTSSGVETVLARYDFAEIAENLTARFAEPEPMPQRSGTIRPRLARIHTQRLSLQRLNWYRLYDLRDLWTMRGGVPEGFRELTLFWELNFLLRAEPCRLAEIWKEAEALASQIDAGGGWYANSDLGTVYRKASEMRDGATTVYQGREYPPLYTPRNQTLIDLFRITSDEERSLRTIISRTERERRRREKRREAGAKPRTVFGDVKPWEAEGISRAWWYRTRRGRE